VCVILEDEKSENVLLRKLVKLLKQQIDDTRTLLCTDLKHLESFLTDEQLQQLTGNRYVFIIHCFFDVWLKNLFFTYYLIRHK